jgi:hypothetical protein
MATLGPVSEARSDQRRTSFLPSRFDLLLVPRHRVRHAGHAVVAMPRTLGLLVPLVIPAVAVALRDQGGQAFGRSFPDRSPESVLAASHFEPLYPLIGLSLPFLDVA